MLDSNEKEASALMILGLLCILIVFGMNVVQEGLEYAIVDLFTSALAACIVALVLVFVENTFRKS